MVGLKIFQYSELNNLTLTLKSYWLDFNGWLLIDVRNYFHYNSLHRKPFTSRALANLIADGSLVSIRRILSQSSKSKFHRSFFLAK